MKEAGVFRTKLFGGFNKKDVFEYFDILKTQINDNNSDIIEKSALQEEKLAENEAEIAELKKKLADKEKENEELIKKLGESNNNAEKISELEDRNFSLKADLNEVTSKLWEKNKYKSHCDELTRKIIKIESELLIKDSKIKKIQSDYDELLERVNNLPAVNDDLILNAKEAITSLAHTLGGMNVLIEAVEKLKAEKNKD